MIRDEHKALIFIKQSETLIYLHDVFLQLKIDVVIIHSNMTSTVKTITQNRFNEKIDSAMILITTFDVDAIELNLQTKCFHVHFFKSSWSRDTFLQENKRCRRLDNSFSFVKIYEYFVQNTFDSRQITRNVEKFMLEIFAHLSQDLMIEQENETVEIENWIWWREELMLINDRRLREVSTKKLIMFSIELLRHMITQQSDKKIVSSWWMIKTKWRVSVHYVQKRKNEMISLINLMFDFETSRLINTLKKISINIRWSLKNCCCYDFWESFRLFFLLLSLAISRF